MIFLFFLLPFFLFAESWAIKTLSQMTLEQKIGQLFVAPACPLRGKDQDHREDWEHLINQFHVGNAIVKHSDPLAQVKFLNSLQRLSPLPLLIAADAEWGLAMRMSDTIAFPKNRTLGAIEDLELIDEMGREVGRQAKRVGIHLNLAPVADINTNPTNPIIGMRAFGEDPNLVSAHVRAMVHGMQSSGIFAAVKHFPGHGDTSVDSHCALPVVSHDRKRLEAIEFLPFRKAIEEGVAAILTAHLLVPALDPDQPATLSRVCLTDVLQNDLGFQGLIISDALNMKALAQTPEEIVIAAFQAGCDLLLYGDHIAPHIDKIIQEDIPKAWKALKKGFEEKTLSVKQLDRSVLKILKAKEQLGLHQSTEIEEKNLLQDLHPEEAIRLKKRLFQEAVVVKGKLEPLPEKTAYLSIGGPDSMATDFHSIFQVEPNLSDSSKLLNHLKEYETVVIGIHQFGPRDQNYGFSPECLALIRSLPKAILCLFGTPYSVPIFVHPGPLLIAFENDSDAQAAVLKILQGTYTNY